jgi:hypothetical protein
MDQHSKDLPTTFARPRVVIGSGHVPESATPPAPPTRAQARATPANDFADAQERAIAAAKELVHWCDGRIAEIGQEPPPSVDLPAGSLPLPSCALRAALDHHRKQAADFLSRIGVPLPKGEVTL